MAFSAVVDPEIAEVDLEAAQRACQTLAIGLLRARAPESLCKRARGNVALEARKRERGIGKLGAIVSLIIFHEAHIALRRQRNDLREHLALRKATKLLHHQAAVD